MEHFVKNKILIVAVSLIVVLGGFFAASKFYKASESKKVSTLAQENFSKLVPDYAPKLGPSQPDVYLVEFLDPECESCRQFHPLVKMILQQYEGRIQLVIRYAPFHPNSRYAIKILEASRKQGKYWETLEVLFRHQPEWGSHHNPRPELIWNYLPQAGVDLNKIKQDMQDPTIEKMIQREIKDLTDLGVRGTPTFFVNGKPLQNFGLTPLRELIASELETN